MISSVVQCRRFLLGPVFWLCTQDLIFEVSCSCLEIYNERVADLLASSGAPMGGDPDNVSTPRGSFNGG